MASFGVLEYWEARYRASSTESFEWFQSYDKLCHLLSPDVLKVSNPQVNSMSFPSRENCRVLILGCGNSSFGADMLRNGWKGKIVNVDFSSVVISQMKERYNDNFYRSLGNNVPRMEYVCADITSRLPWDDKSFDLIICKGALDAVLCGSGSVANVKRMIQECVRLLSNGYGVLFLVTHGNPDSRVVFLEHQNDLSHYWQEVSTHTLPKRVQNGGNKQDYVYICRKRNGDFVKQIPHEAQTKIGNNSIVCASSSGYPHKNAIQA